MSTTQHLVLTIRGNFCLLVLLGGGCSSMPGCYSCPCCVLCCYYAVVGVVMLCEFILLLLQWCWSSVLLFNWMNRNYDITIVMNNVIRENLMAQTPYLDEYLGTIIILGNFLFPSLPQSKPDKPSSFAQLTSNHPQCI
jgi:hypothetical protein